MATSSDSAPLSHITAAILAGGLGTRLRSVVADKPKVLAEIAGRPFIEYLLDQLAAAGTARVVLCVGYKGEMIRDHLGDAYRGMHLSYSHEPEPLGTGGALGHALPSVGSSSLLVLNGDSYCDTPLPSFARWHERNNSPATLLLAHAEDTRRFGRVDSNEAGVILSFREKADTSGPGWINAGVYLLQRSFLESIPLGKSVSLEKEIFPLWIGRGLSAFRADARLWDIGVPDAYEEANIAFRRHSEQQRPAT